MAFDKTKILLTGYNVINKWLSIQQKFCEFVFMCQQTRNDQHMN